MSGTSTGLIRESGPASEASDELASRVHVRTIWISDLHLGTRHSRTDELLDFLRHYRADYMYLVGDVFDGWSLARNWYWSQSHNDVVQKILRAARKGTRVTYVPGNHDEFARAYPGLRFGNILVERKAYHTLLDGRRLLIVHGDEFDGVIRYAKWLQILGAVAYGAALNLNHAVNLVRRLLGKPYWSLSAYLKHRTKKAVQYMARFEELVSEMAREEGVDGVVCGHIHRAETSSIHGVQYLNCGDWVESCTALIEGMDGRIEIVRHHETTAPASLVRSSTASSTVRVDDQADPGGDGFAGKGVEVTI